MSQSFDLEAIRIINFFEDLSGVRVKDCLVENNEIWIVVEEGAIKAAIGRGGSLVKHAEKIFKKKVRIVEYANDLQSFVRNLIPCLLEIKQDGKLVEVKVEPTKKPLVIGRNSKNLKILEKLLQRSYGIQKLRVR